MNHPPPEQRIALVTGAARGIGAAVAARLAEDGCDVAVVDLDAASCEQTLEAVRAHGRRGIALGADVADEAAVASAVERVAGSSARRRSSSTTPASCATGFSGG